MEKEEKKGGKRNWDVPSHYTKEKRRNVFSKSFHKRKNARRYKSIRNALRKEIATFLNFGWVMGGSGGAGKWGVIGEPWIPLHNI